MSNSRQIRNNQIRNPEIKKERSWSEFRDLLTRFFPDRKLNSVPAESKSVEDLKWARDFFDRTNEAFCSAEMNELWETRPNDKVITDCLTNIGKAVLDLRELFTGERAVYKDERLDIEGLSSETSHSIRYWMTEAIGRDVTEFDRFVRTLPRIAQAAVQGREQIE